MRVTSLFLASFFLGMVSLSYAESDAAVVPITYVMDDYTSVEEARNKGLELARKQAISSQSVYIESVISESGGIITREAVTTIAPVSIQVTVADERVEVNGKQLIYHANIRTVFDKELFDNRVNALLDNRKRQEVMESLIEENRQLRKKAVGSRSDRKDYENAAALQSMMALYTNWDTLDSSMNSGSTVVQNSDMGRILDFNKRMWEAVLSAYAQYLKVQIFKIRNVKTGSKYEAFLEVDWTYDYGIHGHWEGLPSLIAEDKFYRLPIKFNGWKIGKIADAMAYAPSRVRYRNAFYNPEPKEHERFVYHEDNGVRYREEATDEDMEDLATVVHSVHSQVSASVFKVNPLLVGYPRRQYAEQLGEYIGSRDLYIVFEYDGQKMGLKVGHASVNGLLLRMSGNTSVRVDELFNVADKGFRLGGLSKELVHVNDLKISVVSAECSDKVREKFASERNLGMSNYFFNQCKVKEWGRL